MRCEKCGSSRVRALETRDSSANSIRRRRACRSCGHSFSTVERIEVYVEGQWVQPEPEPTVVAAPPPLQIQQPAPEPAKEKGPTRQPPRYWPVELEKVAADMEGLPSHLQEEVVTWWNTARRAKHGTKCTWTQRAWELSARRMAALWRQGHTQLVEQTVAEANENGWMALKSEYLRPIGSGPSNGRPPAREPVGLVPRSAAMQQAVETWDSAA